VNDTMTAVTMSNSKIDDLLAAEGAAAEDYEMSEQLPAHVKVSRPGLSRHTVVSVRLSAEEHGKLVAAANGQGLPVSTLMRIWALDRLCAEAEAGDASIAERVARLERAVFRHTA